MKSTVVKRSIVVAGHKTSVSLEDAFLRLFVLEFYRTQPCHGKEGHDGTQEMIGYTAPAFS